MKTTLAAIALALTFTVTASAAEGLVFTVKTHEVLTLRKISKTKFEKISQVATGVATFENVSGDRREVITSQDINEADTNNYISLEVTGKNIVRLVDQAEAINKEVPATISTSLFGSVKKININATIVHSLYANSIKKAGMNAFRNLRMFSIFLSSSLTTTDMNCEADGDLLVCKQDSVLLVGAK